MTILNTINELLSSTNSHTIENKIGELKKAILDANDLNKILSTICIYNTAVTEDLVKQTIPEWTKQEVSQLSEEEILDRFYSQERAHNFWGFGDQMEAEIALAGYDQKPQKQALRQRDQLMQSQHTGSRSTSSAGAAEASPILTLTAEQQKILRLLDHQAAREDYIKASRFCKLIADYVEHNNTENDGLAYKNAYNMTVCFSKIANSQPQSSRNIVKDYIGFLAAKGLDRLKKPLHDSFATFILPKNGQIVTLRKWQDKKMARFD